MKRVKVQTFQKYPTIQVEEGELRHLSTDTVLRYNGHRFGLVLTPAGAVLNHGPCKPRELLTEAVAGTYGLAVCIDNYGGTGRESRVLSERGMEHAVEDGDEVEFDTGDVFTIGPLTQGSRVRREYLALAYTGQVACPKAGR